MPFNIQYLHSYGIRLWWSIRKLWQIFSNERHQSCDRIIDIDFSDFLGVICHFSINIRIEVVSRLYALQVKLLKDILEAWKKEVEKKPPSMSIDDAYDVLNLKKGVGGYVFNLDKNNLWTKNHYAYT